MNRTLAIAAIAAALLAPRATTAAEAKPVPLLFEQRIVTIDLKPDFRDGIQWDLLQLYLKDQESTTGAFPASDRARYRLDFKPMAKSVPPDKQRNIDFETVEQTRVDQFRFPPIWEDTRNLKTVPEDLHFGTLRLDQFKPLMDFLRTQGEARVFFQRKWLTQSGEQSSISSLPEASTGVATAKTGGAMEGDFWEGSRCTLKPEVLESNQIAFHLDSEAAVYFYGDPARNPGAPVVDFGGTPKAKVWRLFRLNTRGVVESGQTAFFEDIREGQGVIVFLTPYILEEHRKMLRE
jgi:hypothetical protein